jgi:hypothetical protein
LLLAQFFSRDDSSNQVIEHQTWLCPLPNSYDFGACLCGKAFRKVTFSTVPGVSFVLQFFALLFFTAQSSGRCYHPSASPVLYPEDREDPFSPPFPSLTVFQFFCAFGFFSAVLLLKIEMEWDGNQRKRISVLAVL